MKIKRNHPMNRLMVYLQARAIFQDEPDVDLNADIVLALHSFGLREISGVGLDNNCTPTYDKANPDFFAEFHAKLA